jgi:glutaredoxin
MVIKRVNSTETDKTVTPPGNKNDARRPPSKRGLYVILIFIVMFIIFSRREPVETIDCTPDIIANKPDVIMLGAWWCTYCYQAKKYFQHNNIHYCEYDMENTEIGKQLYEEHGGGAVPILLIGEYQLSGFSEQQVETALSLLNNNVEK